jgi:hypothetical protein
MNVFADILITDTLTPNMNFQTIGNSILTLFIMSTGDSFYEILKAVSKDNRIDYECIYFPTY